MKQRYKDAVKYIVDRAREPSTWSGVGVMFCALGIHVKSDLVTTIGFIGPGLAGIAAVMLKESA